MSYQILSACLIHTLCKQKVFKVNFKSFMNKMFLKKFRFCSVMGYIWKNQVAITAA